MDAGLKKLVSGRLQAQAAGPHPDPELLAAYTENSLSPGDRHNLLIHVAACADCRNALFLAMPEAETQPVLTPSYKSPRLAVRWATLAASVIVVGAVLLADRGIFNQHARIEPRTADATSQKVAELKAPSMADQASPADDKIDGAAAIRAAAKVRPPLKHMTAKPQATMQFDQSGEVHFASPQSASGANQVSAARLSADERAFAKEKEKKATSVVNWGLSPNGDVQRSLDSGRTWQSLPVAGSPFHAITAVGNDIWVGGSAGALYHSADSGQSWTKVDPVSTDEITHIEFSDPQNGVLNTANGQVWTTSDGGRSWRSK
jgi:Photosynthesis system II assembly factor YCF48/Putative zinc-finger